MLSSAECALQHCQGNTTVKQGGGLGSLGREDCALQKESSPSR